MGDIVTVSCNLESLFTKILEIMVITLFSKIGKLLFLY